MFTATSALLSSKSKSRSRPRIRALTKEFIRVKPFVNPFQTYDSKDVPVTTCMFPREIRNQERVDELARTLEQKLFLEFPGLSHKQRKVVMKSVRPDLMHDPRFNSTQSSRRNSSFQGVPDFSFSIVDDANQEYDESYDWEAALDDGFPIDPPNLVSINHQESEDRSSKPVEERPQMNPYSRRASFLSNTITNGRIQTVPILPQPVRKAAFSDQGKPKPPDSEETTMSDKVRNMKNNEKYGCMVQNVKTANLPGMACVSVTSLTKDKSGESALQQMRDVTLDLEGWARTNLETPNILKTLQEEQNRVTSNGKKDGPQPLSNTSTGLGNNSSNSATNSAFNIFSNTNGSGTIAQTNTATSDEQLEPKKPEPPLPTVTIEDGDFDILLNACRPAILENKIPIRLNVVHEMHPPEALIQGLRDQLGLTINIVSSKGGKTKKQVEERRNSPMTPLQKRLEYGAWFVPVSKWTQLPQKRRENKLGLKKERVTTGISSIVQSKLDEIVANREKEEKMVLHGWKEKKWSDNKKNKRVKRRNVNGSGTMNSHSSSYTGWAKGNGRMGGRRLSIVNTESRRRSINPTSMSIPPIRLTKTSTASTTTSTRRPSLLSESLVTGRRETIRPFDIRRVSELNRSFRRRDTCSTVVMEPPKNIKNRASAVAEQLKTIIGSGSVDSPSGSGEDVKR